mmetsp:Transcript_17900/g.44237  ORF Transcript_17900/g.44237 Transcript_17900/m.44237 type:complete len:128 (+) Transcript_17900:328-711(+)|eukprot:CAMPEP_0113617230 /NCGR_PEP_ID=MMETSP0017_2-20120614/8668_1 /TAXON_ID=2856 /ORGANISM="Cylindrotheca closterium" /LENGTH=127 /DNA_ID=CAMNT_0000526609 /DNA_START=201 /DNA_END=584 /DNA_ORIENTATION=- /assembly_acc=CAM_ASM_000147
MMELEKPKQQRQKRNSGSDGDCSRRKKRRSYSSVAQAWFETLSDAIRDGTSNNDSAIKSPQTPQQRKQRPRRNAFVLHMDAEWAFSEEESRGRLHPESPPPLVQEIVDLSLASEIENLELGSHAMVG